MTTLSNLRIALAEAKIALRSAKDDHDVSRAIAELRAIDRLNGSAGKNEAERARNLTVALSEDYAYTNTLTRLRDAEAKVDRLAAEIAVEEDAVRLNEARIREKLADALMGKTLDNSITDQVLSIAPILGERLCTCDECTAHREQIAENYAKGFPF